MRLSSLASARSAYYDRNATATYSTYVAGVVPHTYTVRWTFTCAAGKKAIMEAATITIAVQGVATVNGSRESFIRVTNPSQATMLYGVLTTNTGGALTFVASPTQPTFYAADTITGNTYDSSTGGTTYFDVNGKFTSYDA